MADEIARRLQEVHALLGGHFGDLGWWPAETPFEVCVGAILTQNTAWSNVEKAIAALKEAAVLDAGGLLHIEQDELARLIRPAGFFNVKSRRLKSFVQWLFSRFSGSLDEMFAGDWRVLRNELLAVPGIGPETGDAILLYAGGKPTFVVDAYTRRLFERMGMLSGVETYEDIRRMFMDNLSPDVALFNNYHALIVELCKGHCRKTPRCAGCPLAPSCIYS